MQILPLVLAVSTENQETYHAMTGLTLAPMFSG